jgi:hypothetical protein
MNLRDATKIINKADTGIMLNRSEQKLAELMLQGNSLADINQQDSSTSNLRLSLDENADLGKFDNKECIKVKHDANLHHMLVVSIRDKQLGAPGADLLFLTHIFRTICIRRGRI